MKKLLLILLSFLSFASYGQAEYEKIAITANTASTTATKINVQETNGEVNFVTGDNIPIPYTPVNYSVSVPTTGGHYAGIDDKLGALSGTTAGISTRVWFTADQTTITAGTFDLTNPLNKGIVASHQQTVANNDNEKKYFAQDLMGSAFVSSTIFPAGVYAGNLSASTSPNSAQQRFTVELYKCNNAGTPIASGITGAPVGSLGVTVIVILDSGLLTLADGSVTNVPVSGNLASPLSMAVGERIRYHVSAEKVGTAGNNITQSVYYGTSYNSYLDVPVPLNTTAVQNLSTVTGATTTDALNTLNTGKIGGFGSAEQVSFWSGSNTQLGDNGLIWDNTNKRFGVGVLAPLAKTHLVSQISVEQPTLGLALEGGLLVGSPLGTLGILMGSSASSGNGWIQVCRADALTNTYNLHIQPRGSSVLIGKVTDSADGVLQVNGQVSASPATLSTQLVTKAQLDATSGGAKRYVALLTQSGTSAPTVTVLENTIGTPATWSYSSVANYKLTIPDAFTVGKTFLTITSNGNFTSSGYSPNNDDVFLITGSANGLANNLFFKVEVYP